MKRLAIMAACTALAACGGTTTVFAVDPTVNLGGQNPNSVLVPLPSSSDFVSSGDINVDYERLINNVRLETSAGLLSFDSRLGDAAQDYAEVMLAANHFSHVGPDGSTLQARVDATGYNWATLRENISAGDQNAEVVFNRWQASPGHRVNNLATDVDEFGLGFAENGSDNRWVLVLGRER